MDLEEDSPQAEVIILITSITFIENTIIITIITPLLVAVMQG
jgi:hypothetical protein